jgi:microcin C transport system substrate-binding protein
MTLSRRSTLVGSALLPLMPLVGLAARRSSAQAAARKVHALAMHGEPKYGPDFRHFDYVNPDAPKGGQLRSAVLGTFDSFNPFILKGAPGPGAPNEPLLTSSLDEPFSHYGLIAETIEVPDDRSWVTFTLRPEARWHDGKPVTVDDVIFSFNILKEKGRPLYRIYYGSVERAEQTGEREVKFIFAAAMNRELPLIIGELPILPKHYWEGRDFEQPTLEPPLGSGEYKVASFEAGRSITLERVPDYWGRDLPVNVGQNNWDSVRYEYFRDETVVFESFKAGNIDIRLEYSAINWATAYDVPPVNDGRIIKEEIPDHTTKGMQGYIFNTRRSLLRDPQIRAAIGQAFDFEWSNRTLFYGQYVRMNSYFSGSELASQGLPAGEELEILEKYRGRIPDAVFTEEFKPPTTDGSGNNRANLRKAADMLKAAGWEIRNGVRTNIETGETMQFEILLDQPTLERITLPFIQNLERLGVRARVRSVDTSQYQNRMDTFDFDMAIETFAQSESPGNEQREFWGSVNADRNGSRNLMGIKDPVIDELIELVISAPDRESLVARTHALDRVLLWGFYVIPHYYTPNYRVAFWNKFSRPKVTPTYSLGTGTWWIDPAKAAALKGKQASQ